MATPMNGAGPHDVIAIGASAGGVEALKALLRGLPRDFRAAIFVVLHLNPRSVSHLSEILARGALLRVRPPLPDEAIQKNMVYVAPPDRHMVLEDSHVQLTTAPKENWSRPAINPLFRSAALAYGPRVIGVILSGTLDDGTAGLWEIKNRGGIAVVQSPEDATHPQMPQSALDNVDVDYVVPVSRMPDLLASLCQCESET